MRCQFTVTMLLALVLAPTTCADDWPQWRGPDRTDVSGETGLLQSWPEGGPQRLWIFENAGVGYSGPAIVDGKLFTMGSLDGTTHLLALDANSGEQAWATSISEDFDNAWGDGPRGTPTVVDGWVYALTGPGDLICASAETGEIKWRVHLVNDFNGRVPTWGYSESPLVEADRVVVTPGAEDAAVVALNKEDGSVIWKSECGEPAQYASIMPVDLAGRRHYIQLFMKKLVGIDAKDGSTIWEADFPGRVAVIPTPIVQGDKVYVSAGYGIGCMLVQFSNDGATEIYRNKEMKNHHGGVIQVGNELYGHSDPNGWVCQDFETGKRKWRARKELGKGAIGYADKRFYCIDEDSGEVKLIVASPERWEETGSFTLEPQTELRKPQGRIWTHPVIVNGKLYLRDQDLIYCYAVSADR